MLGKTSEGKGSGTLGDGLRFHLHVAVATCSEILFQHNPLLFKVVSATVTTIKTVTNIKTVTTIKTDGSVLFTCCGEFANTCGLVI